MLNGQIRDRKGKDLPPDEDGGAKIWWLTVSRLLSSIVDC